MSEPYMVVRGPTYKTRRANDVPRPLDVEVHALRPQDVHDSRRDPEALGVVPLFPLAHRPPHAAAANPAVPRDWARTAARVTGARRGSGVTVAVLDSGIEPTHPAFAHCADRIVPRNFTQSADTDELGHGTHTAGTIFGGTVDGVPLGIAPGIDRALIAKVIGRGGSTTKQVIDALTWCTEQDAQVVSLSLGLDFPAKLAEYKALELPEDVAISKTLQAYRTNVALFEKTFDFLTERQRYFNKTIVFVGASGNESRRDLSDDHIIGANPPAAARGMIAVGALRYTTHGPALAAYSNSGVRFVAPGSDIWSAWLGGTLRAESGTSMATAHVAGIAALWMEHLGRSVSTDWVLQQLEAHAVAAVVPGAARDDIGFGQVMAPAD